MKFLYNFECITIDLFALEFVINLWFGSGYRDVAVLLPVFAISWQQNQVTRQSHLRDPTQIIIFCCKYS